MTEIPEFHLHELLQAVHGYDLIDAPDNSVYCPCPWHEHDDRERALRVWANGDGSSPARDGYVCHYGKSGNTWDYLQDIHDLPPPGPGFEETIQFVCEQLGMEMPSGGGPASPKQKAHRLMRSISDYLRPISFPDQNKHYWFDHDEQQWYYRGIEPMEWLSRKVGMLTPDDVSELEDQFGDEAFEAAGISSWNGGIGHDWIAEGVVVMLTNKHGTPIGLAVRRYGDLCFFDGEPEPKYAKTSSKGQLLNTSEYIYGLSEVNLREDGPTKNPVLYVVEGEFDCLALQMRGINHCVAVGSGMPSGEKIDLIENLGREIIYIADSDPNEAGFHHALNLADTWPEAQFLLLPGEDTDPDDFVQERETEAIEEIVPYTSMQIRMLGQPEMGQDRWTSHEMELAQVYMEEIIRNPSAYDEINVRMIAQLAGLSEDYLLDWLIRERNQQNLEEINSLENAHPVRVGPASGGPGR